MKFVNLILNEMNVLSTKDTGRNMVCLIFMPNDITIKPDTI